jgi:putative OPT family oligopeptide transporter
MSQAPAGTPELTLRVILLGLGLSVVMGAANVYLGLKAGMTVSASIPAAVIAMVILRRVLRNGTVLESNQVQTAASAGESLAAGIIFTMPALVLIGFWEEFDFWVTTAVAFTGGLLGILFMIPMRRVFVVNNTEKLKYPEGIACAAVLNAGEVQEGEEAQAGGALRIVQGAGLGAAFKLLSSFLPVFKGTLEAATGIGSRVFYFGGDVSPALIAVGYIVGLNVASLIFIGGSIAWLVGIPLLGGFDAAGQSSALDTAWTLWSTQIRYVGVGAMIVGGIVSIIRVRHGLIAAVGELKKTTLAKTAASDPRERDLPPSLIIGLGVLATVLVAAVYYHVTDSVGVTALTTVIMIIMAFFFTAVASYIVGLVGNSNNPVSGMTITAVIFTGGMIYLFGYTGMTGMAATLGVAAIVCCAACTSGDVCNDLKTGHIVGAAPYRQQMMQVAGVAIAALVMAPVLQLLHDNTPGGIGGRELAAPQAALFASLAKGFFGDGDIPWNMVATGAVVGIFIWIADLRLERRQAAFRLHLMPVAVGMYLPFGLSTPILLGGVINYLVTRGSASEQESEQRTRPGVLFASGAIAGESLMGVGMALLASVGITRIALDLSPLLTTSLTLAAAAFILFAFQRAARLPG